MSNFWVAASRLPMTTAISRAPEASGEAQPRSPRAGPRAAPDGRRQCRTGFGCERGCLRGASQSPSGRSASSGTADGAVRHRSPRCGRCAGPRPGTPRRARSRHIAAQRPLEGRAVRSAASSSARRPRAQVAEERQAVSGVQDPAPAGRERAARASCWSRGTEVPRQPGPTGEPRSCQCARQAGPNRAGSSMTEDRTSGPKAAERSRLSDASRSSTGHVQVGQYQRASRGVPHVS